jgi:hypothetical protein
MLIFSFQDSEPEIIDGPGTEAGRIISTTVGGRNGIAKQVLSIFHFHPFVILCRFQLIK